MIFMTCAAVWSRATRTGSPPASSTARSYCGMARSANSGSVECSMGMAMRGVMVLAHPFDAGERLHLPVVANLGNENHHKDDTSCAYGGRHCKLTVGDGHIRMNASHAGHNDCPDDCEYQTDRETNQRSDKGHQQDADGNAVPARLAGCWVGCHEF